MTIRLRPHHFLCLLTYVGKGYTPAFTANYDLIAGRLSNGEGIEIVEGPDDICAPLLLEREPHCWRNSVIERDKKAVLDLLKIGVTIHVGGSITLDADLLMRMRSGFAQGTTRSACAGCEWSDLCSSIATKDYNGIKVRTEAPVGAHQL